MTSLELPLGGYLQVSEYEQDLPRLGFPALLSYLRAGDLEGLSHQCLALDRRLREFPGTRRAPNSFARLEDLQVHLAAVQKGEVIFTQIRICASRL